MSQDVNTGYYHTILICPEIFEVEVFADQICIDNESFIPRNI